MKNLALALLLTTICACSDLKEDKKTGAVQQAPASKNAPPENKEKPSIDDSAKAKAWLVKSIEDAFNSEHENKKAGDTASIYTAQYEAYKEDAMSLDFEDKMTPEEFKNKWKDKYNPDYAGSGGLLISGQDWGHITVTRCKLKSTTKQNDFVFDVNIHDSFKADYKRDIRVTHTKAGYKIDDVVEY